MLIPNDLPPNPGTQSGIVTLILFKAEIAPLMMPSASTLTEIFYPHGREAIDMLNFLAEQGELVKATYPNGGVFYKPRNATNISKQ